MPTISTIRQRLGSVNVNSEIKKSIEQTKSTVADLNRDRLLSGKLADGSTMPNYSFISVNVYGYPPGPWRLKNTGAFQAAIKIDVTNVSIVQFSTDPKSEMLKNKIDSKGLDGEKILGMDKEAKKEYIPVVRPVFVGNVREKLHL